MANDADGFACRGVLTQGGGAAVNHSVGAVDVVFLGAEEEIRGAGPVDEVLADQRFNGDSVVGVLVAEEGNGELVVLLARDVGAGEPGLQGAVVRHRVTGAQGILDEGFQTIAVADISGLEIVSAEVVGGDRFVVLLVAVDNQYIVSESIGNCSGETGGWRELTAAAWVVRRGGARRVRR